MHLAVKHQAMRQVAPVGLQRTYSQESCSRTPVIHEIRRLAATDGGGGFEPRARPSLRAPSAHQVVALGELREQARDIGRIVLAVAVDRDHHVAGGLMQPASERRGLARIAAPRLKVCARTWRIAGRLKPLAQHVGRLLIGRAVVEQNSAISGRSGGGTVFAYARVRKRASRNLDSSRCLFGKAE